MSTPTQARTNISDWLLQRAKVTMRYTTTTTHHHHQHHHHDHNRHATYHRGAACEHRVCRRTSAARQCVQSTWWRATNHTYTALLFPAPFASDHTTSSRCLATKPHFHSRKQKKLTFVPSTYVSDKYFSTINRMEHINKRKHLMFYNLHPPLST